MDVVTLTTFAGLAGASIGSITSFWTAWLAQHTQLRNAMREAARVRREEVFRDFIVEASRLYGEALGHQKDDVSELVRLYALVARMRLFASDEVIRTAEEAMDTIVEACLAPNMTLREIRNLAREGGVDFLRAFGEACSSELDQVMTSWRPKVSRGLCTASSPSGFPGT